MARRRIGQEVLVFGDPASQRSRTLDRLTDLVDWTRIEPVLSPIYASAKGEEAWQPPSHQQYTTRPAPPTRP